MIESSLVLLQNDRALGRDGDVGVAGRAHHDGRSLIDVVVRAGREVGREGAVQRGGRRWAGATSPAASSRCTARTGLEVSRLPPRQGSGQQPLLMPSEKTLIQYVQKAAAINEAGIKAPGRTQPKKKEPLAVPAYFSAALKKNAKAQKTFVNFPPSKQREYLEWVTEAKREETRNERLTTSIKWLAEGKPRHWKYQPEKK